MYVCLQFLSVLVGLCCAVCLFVCLFLWFVGVIGLFCFVSLRFVLFVCMCVCVLMWICILDTLTDRASW